MRSTAGELWFFLDISTGDADHAGTAGEVRLRLCDAEGVCSVEQVLGQANHDHFERGRTERHFVRVPPEFAAPDHIRLRLTSGGRWLLHSVRVITPDDRSSYTSGPRDVWLTSDTGDDGNEATVRLMLDTQHAGAPTPPRHARA
ncbi:hypothetical protein SD37_10685 [Amycolatopsis orientalis]|uniref:PLAT domain-containing protein n=1 Tax=Amycolatopsis orientalis TaxID=31958 RepID=A0A193BV15_AMYOR|nr:PLAT/LH2 domain-containing protein [Amycolatopsis orientalis]ANN16062.1 hypothetical protein SD37_10685 [Amycolatopsis orientalis]